MKLLEGILEGGVGWYGDMRDGGRENDRVCTLTLDENPSPLHSLTGPGR